MTIATAILTNRGLQRLASGTWTPATIRAALLTQRPPLVAAKAWDTTADIVGELTTAEVANYSRQTVSGVEIGQNDYDHLAHLTIAPVYFGPLVTPVGAGVTVQAVALVDGITGDVLAVAHLTAARRPDGSPWWVTWPSDGAVVLAHADRWFSTPASPKEWAVFGGRIIQPDGREFIAAGFNGGVTIDVGGVGTQLFGGPGKVTGSVVWAWDGCPGNFQVHADIWPGDANLVGSTEVFPGGHPTAAPDQYAQGLGGGSGGFTSIIDHVYALTGERSPAAIAAGVPVPTKPWRTPLYRVAALTRPGPLTWNNATDVTPAHTIPQYVARARELLTLGMRAVSVQHHGMTGTNPVLPAALIANPTLPITDPALAGSTYDTLRDVLALIDALCAEFSASDGIWVSLPNEFQGAARSAAYDDCVVTLMARVRANGFTGICTFPLAEFAGDLGGLATGGYDTLRARLQAAGLGDNWAVEWHNYGKNTTTGLMATYAEVDAQLTAARDAGWAVWMAEYGQATPTGTGFGTPDAWQREAVAIMATDTYGPPLAVKHAHICATWWILTGDSPFDRSYAVTKGPANKTNEAGPDPHASGTGLGTYGWMDVTTQELEDEWCTEGGKAHRRVAHDIWN